MGGMYPEERTLTIDGETVSFPGLKNGKFTMGNPENPDDKPSFIAPETINLLVDNLSSLISIFGGTPNNTDVDQLKVIKQKTDSLASITSPVFLGQPKVPTPSDGDASEQIANTAFVSKLLPTGSIIPYAGVSIPAGFLLCDGSAISRSVYSNLWNALKGGNPIVFTCTIATKSVFTVASGHGFLGGERLRLFTTGLLTGATLTQDYFVEVIDSTTFYLLSTEGGTTYLGLTAQNGIHTFVKSAWGLGDGVSTFNIPDIRQAALVGSGTGTSHNIASVDAYLDGQFKDDRVGPHEHDYYRPIATQGHGSSTPAVGEAFNATTFGIASGRNGNTTRTKQLGSKFIIKY